MYFSNLTPQEYFYLNQDRIPAEIQDKFQEMVDRLISLEKDNEVLRRNLELAEEQIDFARNLVEEIDAFAEENLSKAKKKVYDQIRENTYFEI
jgi:hypothetical protein